MGGSVADALRSMLASAGVRRCDAIVGDALWPVIDRHARTEVPAGAIDAEELNVNDVEARGPARRHGRRCGRPATATGRIDVPGVAR